MRIYFCRINPQFTIKIFLSMDLMIAENNPRMREMIREICAPFFDKIDECSNGKEAVESLSSYSRQLVIMDINMPVMNGLEASKIILRTHPETKIIMITQYKEKELEIEAMRAGAFYFLLKENLSELKEILAKSF